jgi:hypothetical protein
VTGDLEAAEEALTQAIEESNFGAAWNVVLAAVAAAEKQMAERLVFNLGSLDGKDFMDAPPHFRSEEAQAWASGHDAGVAAAARLARGMAGSDE